MRNSYDESATHKVPTHLFDWAVGDDPEPGTPNRKSLNEGVRSERARLQEQKRLNEALDRMTALGSRITEALEEEGFSAEYELLPEGKVKVSFDEEDGVFNRRRRRVVEQLVGRHAKRANAVVEHIHMLGFANGGDITVGLMGGPGFLGGTRGIDPDFNPFDERHVHVVGEMDVRVDDKVINRIDELVDLWDGDYQVYDEGVRITLREMSDDDLTSLTHWIEGQTSRVGIPGSTLEEVLGDIHRRIRRMRRK